jgi:hypothetical protein
VAVLNTAEILDLLATTQADLGQGKWTDISFPLQEYIAMPMIMQEKKVGFSSGTSIDWRVSVATSGNARMTGNYSTDQVNVKDVFKTASVPWRSCETKSAIEHKEMLVNRSPAQIVSLVEAREADAMTDLAMLLEDRWWNGLPAATNDEDPYNVNYWIVYNATSGFTGGNPSGHSTTAGLDASVYSNWKNWSAQYNLGAFSDINGLPQLREAFTKTRFKAPVPTPGFATSATRGIYCNYQVIQGMQNVAVLNNDQLGRDIAPMDGEVVFRKLPVTYVPALDGNVDQPIYGIDWSVFYPVFLEGDYMRRTGPVVAPGAHNVYITYTDLTFNFVCRDRRKNFVIAAGDPAS